MAASNEWFEYHLTPRGWELGSSKTDFAMEDKTPPPDRVLSVRVSEQLSSTFSRWTRALSETWRSPDSDQIHVLVDQYGSTPK